MPFVKLDATTSTNDFLKELAARPDTENFTVVTAESQSSGRGQMGTKWVSEKGKNLMMSILVKGFILDVGQIYNLNIAVTTAVLDALERHDIPALSIKWPNDIMAGSRKVGGILIENSVKPDKSIVSIVGVGINVNQTDFSLLPKASSIAVEAGRNFDKDALCRVIANQIVDNVNFIAEHADVMRRAYLAKLFKIGVPMPFEDTARNRFMGIIKGVDSNGRLELLLEDDTVKTFGIKQIQMLY